MLLADVPPLEKLSRADYEAIVPELRAGLVDAQRQLRDAGVPVIVIVAGADGVKSETVNRLDQWLDSRGLSTEVFGPRTAEERAQPRFRRYVMALPARGRIAVYFGSWYTEPAVARAAGRLTKDELETDLARIAEFERTLAADGALIVKVWLHLSKKQQRKRLQALAADPNTSWRVSKREWGQLDRYDRSMKAMERVLTRTDTGYARWHLVPAADARARDVAVGRIVLEAIRSHLAELEQTQVVADLSAAVEERAPPNDVLDLLGQVDLSPQMDPKTYSSELTQLQAEVHRLSEAAWKKGRSSVLVFEGWDASGKGGAIRRLTDALDARNYRVVPVGPPTEEEMRYHYLWRFWRHLPPPGRMTIFDRSWYGRVLVERVESLATPNEWARAYREINQFEEHLTEHGVLLVKLWLHISPEEQLRRFEERQATPHKRHKITDEDWRNRKAWPDYELAVNEMLLRTSTPHAPWTVVPAEDKRLARCVVLETVIEALDRA